MGRSLQQYEFRATTFSNFRYGVACPAPTHGLVKCHRPPHFLWATFGTTWSKCLSIVKAIENFYEVNLFSDALWSTCVLPSSDISSRASCYYRSCIACSTLFFQCFPLPYIAQFVSLLLEQCTMNAKRLLGITTDGIHAAHLWSTVQTEDSLLQQIHEHKYHSSYENMNGRCCSLFHVFMHWWIL